MFFYKNKINSPHFWRYEMDQADEVFEYGPGLTYETPQAALNALADALYNVGIGHTEEFGKTCPGSAGIGVPPQFLSE
jgi:hypothetical protein